MKLQNFMNMVPSSVQRAAYVVLGIGVVVGPIYGYKVFGSHQVGTLAGIGFGAIFAIWLLCLGYVYADARRRNMRAALWVCMAVMVPNLLGFLLYFALRQPIATPCKHCGQSTVPGQRFCAWCGYQEPTAPTRSDMAAGMTS
jgi:hypothetical protein